MKKLLAFLVVATLLATLAVCSFSASAAGTNIAKGKEVVEQKISTHTGVSFYNAKLTDGEATTELNYDKATGEWYSFYYSAAATGEGNVNVEHSTKPGADGKDIDVNVGTVIIDLASVSTVDSIKIHFNKDYLPETAELLLSEDGKNYTSYSKKNITAESGEVEGFGMWVEFKADVANGRYVKLVCTFSGMFCMLNEIEVYGTENVGDNSEASDGSEATGDNSETTGDNSETTGDNSEATDSSDATDNSSEATDNSSEATGNSSTEESTTSTPATSTGASSETSAPTTGDGNMIIFAVLAVVALGGAFVAIRVRH